MYFRSLFTVLPLLLLAILVLIAGCWLYSKRSQALPSPDVYPVASSAESDDENSGTSADTQCPNLTWGTGPRT